jgi:hypothetical protein
MEEEMSEIERLYWEDATPEKFDQAGHEEAPFGTSVPGRKRKFSPPFLPDCRHWRVVSRQVVETPSPSSRSLSDRG